jgi:hypothetical protein
MDEDGTVCDVISCCQALGLLDLDHCGTLVALCAAVLRQRCDGRVRVGAAGTTIKQKITFLLAQNPTTQQSRWCTHFHSHFFALTVTSSSVTFRGFSAVAGSDTGSSSAANFDCVREDEVVFTRTAAAAVAAILTKECVTALLPTDGDL